MSFRALREGRGWISSNADSGLILLRCGLLRLDLALLGRAESAAPGDHWDSGYFRWVLNHWANWTMSFSMPGQPWSLPGSRMSLKVAPVSRAFFSKISAW
jgi:hypothetical protein